MKKSEPPNAAARPRPPLNLSQTEKQCPATAKIRAVIKIGNVLPNIFPAINTERSPLRKSIMKTVSPENFEPETLKTFIVPTFPVPSLRMLTPFFFIKT